MKENCEVIDKIIPLLNHIEKFREIEEYLLMNSNLPGPRSNLSLAFKYAEFFKKAGIGKELRDLLFKWAGITAEEAPTNDPGEYLCFCGVLALGGHYYYAEESIKPVIMEQLKLAMNDKRWRVRESAAMGLQLIGEQDFSPIRENFLKWYTDSNNLEKRAFLAALAHPPILKNKEIVRFSLNLSDEILTDMVLTGEDKHRDEDFIVLSKGLQYCLSVFITELPEEGFDLLKKYARSKNKEVVKIIKANLGKARLVKKYPQRVNEISAMLS